MFTQKYDSILFDLDGTLWDASQPLLDSWASTLKTHFPGMYVPEEDIIKGAMGNDLDGLVNYYKPYYGERAREIVLTGLEEEVPYVIKNGGAIIYEGTRDTLEKLCKTKKLFIVSNCQVGYIENFLEYSGLAEYFTSFICAGETGLSKGENAIRIIEKFNLSSPLFIGDTKGDEQAARLAGIDFAYAAYGFGSADSPDYTINSITELAD